MVDESPPLRESPRLTRRLDPSAAPERLAELVAVAARAVPFRACTLNLPTDGQALSIVQPDDLDALLDLAADDPEQNLPYWAELWPSGIALADAILRQPDLVWGKRVLELGCGLGVTAIAALRSGADLLVTDYTPEALALCAINCLNATGHEPTAIRANWRSVDPGEFTGDQGPFPVVLAADVLYEQRDVAPLLDLVGHLIVPGGLLWLAEPGRRPAAEFLEEIARRGWRRASVSSHGPWPDPEDNSKGVVVNLHRLTRPVS